MGTTLAKYGMPGIALALVIALTMCMQGLFTITGNHIDHNTAAIQEQTIVISALNSNMLKNTMVLESIEHALSNLEICK